LPSELKDDLLKYDQNPNCACNLPIYVKVLKHASKELREWFPGREVLNPDLEMPPIIQNNWTVVNCNKDDLEKRLKDLGPGRVQIAVCRYQDEVTVIINNLDNLS
jgi:hypothetical protein